MKLRQNKLIPLRLKECLANHWTDHPRFDEILEALDTKRLSWLSETTTAQSAHSPQSPNPSQQNSPTLTAGPVAPEWSLGTHLAKLPEQTLGEYTRERSTSLLSHVFRIAGEYQSHTDRVVFLGDAQSQSAIKTILQGCCDPFWNSWTRAERGSKPRLYFAGDSWDNDTHQALVELFSDRRALNRREEFDWGVVRLTGKANLKTVRCDDGLESDPVSDPVESFAAILKQIHAARHSNTSLPTHSAEDFWIDCLPHGPSSAALNPTPPQSTSAIPSNLLAFTFSSLLPAAILGVNVMELLSGAYFISKEFFERDKSTNPVLRWAAWQILAQEMEMERQLHYTNSTLESGARWLIELYNYPHLFNSMAETSPNSVGWKICPPHHYHACNHSHNHRDILQCHLLVDSVRYDALQIPAGSASMNYRDQMQRHIEQKIQRLGTNQLSGLIIEFPVVDELAMGQWMQWMLLSHLLQTEMRTTVGKSADSGI